MRLVTEDDLVVAAVRGWRKEDSEVQCGAVRCGAVSYHKRMQRETITIPKKACIGLCGLVRLGSKIESHHARSIITSFDFVALEIDYGALGNVSCIIIYIRAVPALSITL